MCHPGISKDATLWTGMMIRNFQSRHHRMKRSQNIDSNRLKHGNHHLYYISGRWFQTFHIPDFGNVKRERLCLVESGVRRAVLCTIAAAIAFLLRLDNSSIRAQEKEFAIDIFFDIQKQSSALEISEWEGKLIPTNGSDMKYAYLLQLKIARNVARGSLRGLGFPSSSSFFWRTNALRPERLIVNVLLGIMIAFKSWWGTSISKFWMMYGWQSVPVHWDNVY